MSGAEQPAKVILNPAEVAASSRNLQAPASAAWASATAHSRASSGHDQRRGIEGRRRTDPWPYDGGVSEAIAALDFESWLVAEERAERRHEYVGGRTYLMAGGTERHDLAAGLLYEHVAVGARSAGCRPFAGNRIVRTPGGSAYYPDVMVACGKAPHRLYETEPVIVIEVLSPSTSDMDRREKALAYAAIDSLRLLVLVDPVVRRAEVARIVSGRLVSWDAFGPGDTVPTPYGDIDVDALHDQIDVTATT